MNSIVSVVGFSPFLPFCYSKIFYGESITWTILKILTYVLQL